MIIRPYVIFYFDTNQREEETGGYRLRRGVW